MASDPDGPDFSYAFGSAAWNPALRPNDDSEPTMSPVTTSTKRASEVPEHLVAGINKEQIQHPPVDGESASPFASDLQPAGSTPRSQGDFFDRLGHGDETLSAQDNENAGDISGFEPNSIRPSMEESPKGQTPQTDVRNNIEDPKRNQDKDYETRNGVDLFQGSSVEASHLDETYDFQGQTTFLEEAREESAEQPLVKAGEESNIDWGTTDDAALDLGEPNTTNMLTASEDLGLRSSDMAFTAQDHNPDDGSRQRHSIEWEASDGLNFDVGAASQHLAKEDSSRPNASENATSAKPEPKEQDIAALWQAALADDDLLPDSTSNAFSFGDDDGGFLDDVQPPAGTAASISQTSLEPQLQSASRYEPTVAQQQSLPASQNQYLPSQRQFTDFSQLNEPNAPQPYSTPFPYQSAYTQEQPQRPALPASAESFANKAKGGYHSPYDLPEDLAKPRRRPMHHTSSAPAVQSFQPPPRTTSISTTPLASVPPQPAHPSLSYTAHRLTPPSSSHSNQAANGGPVHSTGDTKPPGGAERKSSADFFAELPVVHRPRHHTPSGRYGPQAAVPTPPPGHAPPVAARPSSSHILPAQQSAPPVITQLRHPERVLPYAEEPTAAVQRSATMPMPPANRYSPTLPPPTEAVKSRYSPAPPAPAVPPNRYSPAPSTTAPPTIPHQRYPSEPAVPPPTRTQPQPYAPRTSSPLAHSSLPQKQQPLAADVGERMLQEVDPGQHGRSSFDRSMSLSQNPLQPVAEDEPFPPAPSSSLLRGPDGVRDSSPGEVTPPPAALRSGPSSAMSSPRKRSNYAPSHQFSAPPPDPGFAPPQRSLTSSPGKSLKHTRLTLASPDRPASAHGLVQPLATGPSVIQGPPRRGTFAQELNMIVPHDERAGDALERWRGAPIFKWGSAGLVLTSYPKYVQRYGQDYLGPAIKPTQNDVRTRNIKDVFTLSDTLVKFPGPLKKGKKREVVAWLKTYVDSLERSLQGFDVHSGLPITPDIRTTEKLLLWKLLTVFVENDGQLEGGTAVDEAVRKLLSSTSASQESPSINTSQTPSSLQPEAFDPNALGVLRDYLTQGQREKAVWHAVDQRLWAHGLLIASTLPKDIWKQVVQEFVRKEIRKAGDNTESLAALYQVFAGNWEESIDELVSVSARAGFQMVSTSSTGGAPRDALAGLDKWRETLDLVLHNRSPGDVQALLSLGRLLRGYGRVEAAHICFLFARSIAAFGGIEDPAVDFCLIGAEPAVQGSDFGGDLVPILLSEVYEFALTLSNSPAAPAPHLQAYKLYHAEVLGEAGYTSEAQAYCDAIQTIIHSKTKPSPYYNLYLIQRLDELNRKLSQATIDNSSSWKPSMDKVSSSLFAKFNSFVTGEDSDAASNASGAGPGADPSQFTSITGDASDASKHASNADLYNAMNGTISVPPPTNSKYAPLGAYTARGSLDQQRTGSSRYEPGAYHPRSSLESTRTASAHVPSPSADSNFGVAASPQRAASYNPSHLAQYTNASQLQGARFAPNVLAPASGGSTSHSPYAYSPYESASPAEPAEAEYKPQSSPIEIPSRESSFGYQIAEPQQRFSRQAESGIPSADDRKPSFSYEPPTQESSSYEPPSYQPYEPEPAVDTEEKSPEEEKPKKKAFMDDDDDDELFKRAEALKKQQKSEADRAADEAFRKAAEADAAKPSSSEKKGWFGGWFKRDASATPGPIKAKLGEENSFVYDPELKRWVNKAAGAAAATPAAATPPPPKTNLRPTSSSSAGQPPLAGGPPQASTSTPSLPAAAAPPPGRAASVPPLMARQESQGSSTSTPPAAAARPPSRPATSMSNAGDLDDLLGAPAPRRAGAKKGVKKGRYVDIMANAK